MMKTFLAGTAALAIVGATFAIAEPGSFAASGDGAFQRVQRWRPSAEDISAFSDARIAALHAGLRLTADQEKNWPPVEGALRDLAKQRLERFAARASADRPQDPIERLNLRADAMGKRAASLKKLADAAGPLYKSLDESQKHRFVMLARVERRHPEAMRGHNGLRDWMMNRGPRGMMQDGDGQQ